jgi:hypothetical protein
MRPHLGRRVEVRKASDLRTTMEIKSLLEVAMPKTTKSGQAKKSELPSTLRRSGKKAQQTFARPTTRHWKATKATSGRRIRWASVR